MHIEVKLNPAKMCNGKKKKSLNAFENSLKRKYRKIHETDTTATLSSGQIMFYFLHSNFL